jgi:DNA-directed RNA polymerase subunit RPC12/RpoP
MIKTTFDGFSYDTENIKENCVNCGKEILGDTLDNYERRGNYCSTCNAKLSGKHYE